MFNFTETGKKILHKSVNNDGLNICYCKMQVLCSVSCVMITLLCHVRSCEYNAV